MDSADQVIIHVNSHGPAAISNRLESNNRFKNLTKKPIEDINKIGLLYCSIPRIYDRITENKRQFSIRLRTLANPGGEPGVFLC